LNQFQSTRQEDGSGTATTFGSVLDGLVQQANGLFDGSGRLLTDSGIVQSINSAIEAAGGSDSIVGGFIEVRVLGVAGGCVLARRAGGRGRRERGGA